MISYKAHISNYGWMPPVFDNMIAGTVGASIPLEAFQIDDLGEAGVGVQAFAHVQDLGWSSGNILGEPVGSTGLGKHIEAVKLGLIGENADKFDIWYRLHLANFGWLEWSKNGELNGTVGGNVQAEAIQIQFHAKSDNITPQVDSDFTYKDLTPQNPPVSNAPNILDRARQDLGYITGTSEDSVFGRRIAGEMAGDWCCYAVVCWALDAGLNVPVTGYVPTMKSWAEENGRWTGNPQPGYFVLFDFNGNGTPDHIGIVEEVHASDCVTSIEGNTDQGSGIGVYRVYRDYGILGYVNPF